MMMGSSIIGATVTRATLPWLLLGAMVALVGTGGAGMYYGKKIADADHAATILDLKNAHIHALQARTDQYLQAVARGDEVANRFEKALQSIKIENKTFNNEVQREIEKVVYTDCRLPDSGADLLSKQVDAVNMRLLGATKAKK